MASNTLPYSAISHKNNSEKLRNASFLLSFSLLTLFFEVRTNSSLDIVKPLWIRLETLIFILRGTAIQRAQTKDLTILEPGIQEERSIRSSKKLLRPPPQLKDSQPTNQKGIFLPFLETKQNPQ
jgi:hypothetical protein